MIQHAIHALPPFMFNAVRFIGAAALLGLIITIFYRQMWSSFSVRMLVHGSLLGLFLFLGYGFQTVGLLYTTTSNAGFITGLSVIIVPFLSLMLLRQKISWMTCTSALLAAAGLYLLTFSGGSMNLNRGDVMVLFCAIAFALHVAFSGRFAPRYPALLLAAIQLAVTGILSLLTSLGTETNGSWTGFAQTLMRPEVALALIISIGPTSAFAFWIQMVCQQYTTPNRVAVIFAMEPVFAALTGMLFAGEQLGWIALAGCVCILTGMIIAEWRTPPIIDKEPEPSAL
ncbi:drug/metabolite transporter (DMT)-like permease [Paenibacillus shirakamiensis]|uniref:Drug/metabolite transporter (DMT)-like permease n=2 Tax=Paenibacillus shirakamiensis TaxID=1265935 RepID=A0ABS4JFQ8_9BACL|nr:drug/metabolite transporter (DMT)-like permease [Paenibacillus shirakamiensis]